ncbi:hypothetical protein MHUMG1_07415 [Metarhizium humberi]|uniref:Uncharacterized protein n=1 Tax=Metarhizium humberi TaxID=2596975 RepID=A0A9P8M4Y0_9HYPO|nr:hypothetical protein MHUMG1_07415 [Metarhizium humberi]
MFSSDRGARLSKESLQDLVAVIPSLRSVDPGKLSKHVVADGDGLVNRREAATICRNEPMDGQCGNGVVRVSRLAYGVETGSEISVPAGNVADAFGQLENLTQLGRDVDLVAMEPFAVPDAGSTFEGLPQVTKLLAFENDTCGVSS